MVDGAAAVAETEAETAHELAMSTPGLHVAAETPAQHLRDDSWKLQTFSGHFHVEVMISALEAKMMRKDLYQWVVSLPVQVASTV